MESKETAYMLGSGKTRKNHDNWALCHANMTSGLEDEKEKKNWEGNESELEGLREKVISWNPREESISSCLKWSTMSNSGVRWK